MDFNKERILKKTTYGLLLLMPLFFIRRTMDTDFWFMASHGRYLMTNGFPTTEILTVHSDYAFQIQKWATCVLFYQIYTHWGTIGMYVFLYAISILTEVLMYRVLKYISNNTLSSVFITSVSMIMLNHAFIVTRPQVFSYICILLEIYVLEAYVKTSNLKHLLSLPMISVLYMQLHSTQWIMLLIILLCYLCDFSFIKITGVTSGEVAKTPILLSGLIMFFAGIINPYGIESFRYIYNSLRDTSHYAGITECQPATYKTAWIFLPGLFLFAYGLWKNKTFKLRYLYLALGTLFMGLLANRNEAYTILGMAVVSAFLWKDFELKTDEKKRTRFILSSIVSCVIISTIGLVTTLYPHKPYDYDIIDVINTMGSNVEPSRNVKVFTTTNTGAYAEWVGYTTYIDARTEVFAKSINGIENTNEEMLRFLNGYILISDMTEKYDFDYYIIPRSETINIFFASEEYPLMYQNNSYIVYKTTK